MQLKHRNVVIRLENGDTIEDGDVSLQSFPHLLAPSQIQNILSWHGLCSKVVGLGIHQSEPCQIMESPYRPAIHSAKSQELAKQFHFEINNQLGEPIDFFKCKFAKDYTETVKEIYAEQGKYGKVYYQDVPELKLRGGPRKSLDRINYLGLTKIDFTNKTFIDLGCAGGFFCRYADNHGASRVMGVDQTQPISAARHLANCFSNFNIDYEVADLSKGYRCRQPYDIAFFLSMIFHIDVPDVVKQAHMVVFEDNGKKTRHLTNLGKPWTDWFKRIEFIGKAIDHGDKSIYHLHK